jgi:hypothetical protein
VAEDAAVKSHPTDGIMNAGAERTRTRDDPEGPTASALWLRRQDMNEWHLRCASPAVSPEDHRLEKR